MTDQATNHPGMTVGNMETAVDFWVCQHCLGGRHELCTGLSVDPEDGEAYACECEGVHPLIPKT